jgi:hypothetical protein
MFIKLRIYACFDKRSTHYSDMLTRLRGGEGCVTAINRTGCVDIGQIPADL